MKILITSKDWEASKNNYKNKVIISMITIINSFFKEQTNLVPEE